MAKEQSPAFQFYVKEWRSSRAIARMSFALRGMYLEMLLEQWENLTLPDDPRACAVLLGGTEEEWIAAWPNLRRRFCDRRGRPRKHEDLTTDYADPATWSASKQIINLKLEDVRREQRRYKKAAKIGGVARAKSAKRNNDGTYSDASQPAVAPAVAPAASPAISSTPTATATATPTATPTPTAVSGSAPPAFAGRQKPLPHYRRLRIFPWMVDDLLGMLGDSAEAFDLDLWLSQLDESGRVLPPNLWPWLKDAVSADAAKRGMGVAAIAPTNKRIAGLVAGGEAFLRRVAEQREREGR